ncbi:MAG: terminase large subunit [Oscillospiraceae bacterium]|nr:terminase large subunit [Oscillospiraceae bacterium]
MPEVRRGRQTPTQAVTLPYESTHGSEAVELYKTTGREAQEWQALLLYDLLAVNEDGLWTHTKFGYSVPRRNGKNEVVAIREMWGLVNGEHILHTAHRTTTTHSAWERLLDLLGKAGLEIVSSYRAFGKEHIELDCGGKIEFRTRTSKGGLGEGFDLLIIDEAQEYQDDQESALKYVVTDSQNPQTIFTGTPPTPVSSGTVFTKFRQAVLAGGTENSAWEEWSVPKMTDIHDRDAWFETNPSLGTVFTERSVADEMSGDPVDFNIQRLGLWIQHNQKSAISRAEWEELQVKTLPELTGKMFVGIKYGHDGQNVSLSVAIKTKDGRIFVEAVDCRPVRAGAGWIISFLQAAAPGIRKVVVDGANGQNLLAAEMKDAGLKAPVLPTVKQIIVAHTAFEQGLYSSSICHKGQPALTQSVSNCEKRAIGSNGGFGYRSIKEGVDVSLLDSVILAYWAASEDKGAAVKQKVSY